MGRRKCLYGSDSWTKKIGMDDFRLGRDDSLPQIYIASHSELEYPYQLPHVAVNNFYGFNWMRAKKRHFFCITIEDNPRVVGKCDLDADVVNTLIRIVKHYKDILLLTWDYVLYTVDAIAIIHMGFDKWYKTVPTPISDERINIIFSRLGLARTAYKEYDHIHHYEIDEYD